MEIVEGVHIVTGQPIFEVVKDCSHMAYFAHRDEAECYIKRIEAEREVSLSQYEQEQMGEGY